MIKLSFIKMKQLRLIRLKKRLAPTPEEKDIEYIVYNGQAKCGDMERIYVLLAILVLVVGGVLLKNKTKFNTDYLIKGVAVAYFLICFVKLFFADGFIWVINGGFYSGVMYQRVDVLQSLLRWGMYFSSAVIVVATFTKVKLFKNVSVFVCLPVLLASLYCFPEFIEYYMDGTGRGIKTVEWVRELILAVEFICGITLPLMFTFIQNHRFNVLSKREWLNFLLITPVLVLTMFPVYTIQSLFGYTNLSVGMFKPITIAWVILTVVIILALVKIFKHRSYDERFALCLWLALGLFMHYNSLYLMGFSIERLPIQLCNLGAYFFLLCIVTKSKRLFDFAFVANIVGTIIAMIVPDIEGGVGYFWNIHFMLEHMLVLIVPAVMMGVGIFPRINKASLKSVYGGFLIYFGFCLISGGLLNIFREAIGEEVNYFYLFDPELIFEVLPGMKFILDVKVVINGYYFYPLYILGVFLVYSILLYLFYFMIQALYKVTDDQEEIYNNKHKFIEYLKQRKKLKGKEGKKC